MNNRNHKKKSARLQSLEPDGQAILYKKFLMLSYGLEVVVDAEAQVSTVKTDSEVVALVIAVGNLGVSVRQSTDFGYKADLVVQIHSNTRIQTDAESVNLYIASLLISIVKTQIAEEVHLLPLHDVATEIGRNLETIGLNTVILAVGVTNLSTNSPVVIEVITNLRKNFESAGLGFSDTILNLVVSVTYTTTNIPLSVHSSSNTNSCQSHHNLFHFSIFVLMIKH